MKNKILILLITLFCSFSTLQGKWWIFGGAEEEVGFDYLYAGSLSFDDIDEEAVILTDSLDSGYLHIRGKGRSDKNKIGAISISLDGAKTWKKIKFEKDGGFDYSFEPNIENSYDIYLKIIDTTGKSNEIEDSKIKISFSNLDVREQILKTLTALKNAYENEAEAEFMAYVSSDFEGDDVTLERAIRKDFSVLEDINIDFTINSVAFSGNKYYASISFTRRVINASDGSSINDNGVTEFTFSVGSKGAMLLSMKNPLIFGLTYAQDVASGTTASTQNDDTFLTISDNGTVKEDSISNVSNGSSGDYMTSGSFVLDDDCSPPCNNADGINFTNDEKTTLISDSEVYKEMNLLWGNAGTTMIELGKVNFDNITVPTSGYHNNGAFLDTDEVIAIRLPNNTYAVIKVTNVIDNIGSGGNIVIYIDYKYDPEGGTTFP